MCKEFVVIILLSLVFRGNEFEDYDLWEVWYEFFLNDVECVFC